ncbi:hypothetical protein [Candidatus Mycoplasma haematobovis]|uniref:hypothetical protein n=1 Tax=Candidatus Mycoplasma haematobovis TaxID=432608 RepID=UPI000B238F0B|nr:hypothetical protein [Candidatus Mycoplasma haematobovis]
MNKAGIKKQILICNKCKATLGKVDRFGKRDVKKYVCSIHCRTCSPNYIWEN